MIRSVPNPSTGKLRQVEVITDRAKRLRARRTPPPAPKLCHYCGAKNPRDIDHVDGNEDHGEPANLTWACRTCNTTKGIAFRNAGRGKLTRQYNPASASGAKNLAQYMQAVLGLKGQGDMPLGEAIAMVRATSHSKRSEFAQEIWRRRKARSAPF